MHLKYDDNDLHISNIAPVVYNTEHDSIIYEFLNGPYLGIAYAYSKIALHENKLSFTYDVIHNPNNVDTDCNDFIDQIGDALVKIIAKSHEFTE